MMQTMVIFVFWLNIIGFTSLFGAFVFSYIMYQQEREPYRYQYIHYISISWLFFLGQFIGFVQVSFFNSEINQIFYIIGYLQTLFSLLLLYRIPLFVYTLLGYELNPSRRLLALIAPLIFAIGASVIIRYDLKTTASWVSVFANALVGVTFLITKEAITQKKRESSYRMCSFLTLSSVSYFLFSVYGTLFIFFPSEKRLIFDAALTGLFITVWCMHDVLLYLRNISVLHTNNSPVHKIEEYQLSSREQEIFSLLLTGKSYKDIALLLSISTRTVETHVYRIYKKCQVNNKIDLIHKFGLRT